MTDLPEPGSPQEPQQATPEATPPSAVSRPFTWRLPTALVAIVFIGALLWWNADSNSAAEPRPTPTPVSIAVIPTATPRPPTRTPTPIPTATPTVAVDVLALLLPTVTPSAPAPEAPVRTVEFGGQLTLRMELANPAFSASGRPLTITMDPRTFDLGGSVNAISDRWCVAVGASGLVFDLTLRLNPADETLSVTGEMHLYDGFCHDLGARRASVPLTVDIPAEASARVVQSLHAESDLLNRSDLLQTSTGVYAELTIRNPRPR